MNPPTVNLTLTPDRPTTARRVNHPGRVRNIVENDDYAAFTRRILAAHGRRIARGDIEGLTDLAALATCVDHALHTAAAGLRQAGFSWTDIGDRLGISRQAAHQRFGTSTEAAS
ncbi:hypothetical protein Psed_5229 [Pseudonocardia dioxanivorans CB1190]|uniref:Uncharacterized protein n=1 Tax=Pseudonocardia dioxanivorans (strain ATCC 55486 / DSM 44775 / JCM 13855 / CB1190) TaxID=675635 RepID=F4CTE0_PSEUX|nr:hypothetical protein [Pseudonocardia dioxanivorans]AEA27365.1 hypothetical protein Psed_5229 [Pseudonocardia dioxanivorans CB1190]